MTKMERYYFSVVVRELMNILRDSQLWAHHEAAVGAWGVSVIGFMSDILCNIFYIVLSNIPFIIL